jgi:uncharacterized membrane protein YvbJ
MVMKLCPNCLISVSKEKCVCHQCGHNIDKRPVSKSQKIVPKSRSYKSILLQKLKLLKSTSPNGFIK